jgi:hypothetical protein
VTSKPFPKSDNPEYTTAPILVPKMGAVVGNFFGIPAVRLRGPMGFASPGCPGFALVGKFKFLELYYDDIKCQQI